MRRGSGSPAPFMPDDTDSTESPEFDWRGEIRTADRAGVPAGMRRRGRPRGSANRAPIVRDVQAAAASVPESQRFPDVAEMIRRQLSIISSAQQNVEERLKSSATSMREISDLSSALDKAMAAVSRAAQAQEDVLARMSQAQLLESAIRRLEEQPEGVINLVIRRLKGAREALVSTGPRTAAAEIASLENP